MRNYTPGPVRCVLRRLTRRASSPSPDKEDEDEIREQAPFANSVGYPFFQSCR